MSNGSNCMFTWDSAEDIFRDADVTCKYRDITPPPTMLLRRPDYPQHTADFAACLDGSPSNIHDILANFHLRNQVLRVSKGDALSPLIEELSSQDIKLNPCSRRTSNGTVRHTEFDKHPMGCTFTKLFRRSKDDEEAAERCIPRHAVTLRATRLFRPSADPIRPGTYLFNDCARASGRMFTVANKHQPRLATDSSNDVSTYQRAAYW